MKKLAQTAPITSFQSQSMEKEVKTAKTTE
jgi:hypothetical protein